MSFTDIPLEDINTFLSSNHIEVEDSDPYRTTLNSLLSENFYSIPDGISDWIIAYNIGKSQIPIAEYAMSTILFASDNDLQKLSQLLELPEVNKERIIRILTYLQV